MRHRTSAHNGSPIGLTQIVDQQLGRLSNELMHGVALQGGIVGEQPQAYQAPYHCTPQPQQHTQLSVLVSEAPPW